MITLLKPRGPEDHFVHHPINTKDTMEVKLTNFEESRQVKEFDGKFQPVPNTDVRVVSMILPNGSTVKVSVSEKDYSFLMETARKEIP